MNNKNNNNDYNKNNIKINSKYRISKDEYYINIAREVCKRSTCLKRHYGAVIVNNDEIVSTGYNGAPRGDINCCDRGTCPRINVEHNSGNYNNCCAVHAEMNAIISASRKEMMNGTIYLYGEEEKVVKNEKTGEDEVITVEVKDPTPCPICEKLIKNAGIDIFINNSQVKYFD